MKQDFESTTFGELINANTIEGLVAEMERQFPILSLSFAHRNIPLVEVNATSEDLLLKYQREVRENMKGFANCKVLKRDCDARVKSAYYKLMENVDMVLAGVTQ